MCSTLVDVPLTFRLTFPVARVAFVTMFEVGVASDRRLDGATHRALDLVDGLEP